MSPLELESFLRQQIPISETMGFQIHVVDESQVQIIVPLQPNRNHLGTAFGGSLYSMAVLSCYAWLFNQMRNQNLSGHVVIKTGQIEYLSAVSGDFTSVCQAPSSVVLEKFLQTMKRKSKSQILLKSQIIQNSKVKCEFTGEFVSIL